MSRYTEMTVWLVERCNNEFFRAELWHRPYDGWMIATTRKVSTRRQAIRDGVRVYKGFARHESQQKKEA